MRKSILLAAAAAIALTPAVGPAQSVRYLNQREVAEAQRQHPALVEEFGGAETGPRAAYVQSVGRRVAAYSGVASQAYNFTTLNSAVENAFAVPGGYIYITRQLMALMNDESELAFVLGHETGHIAGNHHRQRQSAAQRNTISAILGAVLGSVVGGQFGSAIAQMSQQAAQMWTLSFSRDQEYQADRLGIQYMTRAGYDPTGSATMLAALTASSALEARIQGRDNRQTPEWASTHPLSVNRTRQALTEAQRTGRYGTGIRNRDQFLTHVEGLTVDDDPAQGVIDGRTFTHPDLRMQFTVPVGYLMQNGTTEVSIAGSAGKAQFSGGRFTGSLEDYVTRVIQRTAGQVPVQVGPAGRTVVNGIPALYTTARARTSSGVVDLSVFAYDWDANTKYHFVMLTQGGAGIGPFTPMVGSLRRISAAEAAAIRPRVIDVVTVGAGDTIQSLASRMAYRDYRLERFLTINGLNANSRLTPGQKVKIVVYGPRRS